MPKLDINANWWDPNIKTRGLPSVSTTATKQVLVGAVAGQHIVLAGFSLNDDRTSVTTLIAIELWWGAAATWAAATAAERVLANTHQMNAALLAQGGGHMAPVVWPVGVGPVSPVNTPLNVRTASANAQTSLLYNVTYYMVDSTTLRPV